MTEYIIKLEMIKTAINGFGKVIGFTESPVGTVCAVEFIKPIVINSSGEYPDQIPDLITLNGCAGGMGWFGPLSISLSRNKADGPFFVSEDSKTLVFDFYLRKEFIIEDIDEDIDEQTRQIIHAAKIFFERIEKHGIYVWQSDLYISMDAIAEEINDKLAKMEKWWHGSCVLKVSE